MMTSVATKDRETLSPPQVRNQVLHIQKPRPKPGITPAYEDTIQRRGGEVPWLRAIFATTTSRACWPKTSVRLFPRRHITLEICVPSGRNQRRQLRDIGQVMELHPCALTPPSR